MTSPLTNRERVRQIEAGALAKLRNPKVLERLRSSAPPFASRMGKRKPPPISTADRGRLCIFRKRSDMGYNLLQSGDESKGERL
ncbi:MAG: hypothetical protein KGO05_03545 [Chloroflexota bacterium]|nr:hypothetical protein [Chloroflexota bacterium]